MSLDPTPELEHTTLSAPTNPSYAGQIGYVSKGAVLLGMQREELVHSEHLTY